MRESHEDRPGLGRDLIARGLGAPLMVHKDMFRLMRRMPFFMLLAIAKTVLLARRHFTRLDEREQRRLGELVRRGHRMSRPERDELSRVLGKLEPRAFAFATANAFSPVRLPRRLAGAKK